MKTRFHVPSKRVPAKAWWEIKRWDPARTRHAISSLARSLRIGSVGKNLLLMIALFAAVPAGSRPAGLLVIHPTSAISPVATSVGISNGRSEAGKPMAFGILTRSMSVISAADFAIFANVLKSLMYRRVHSIALASSGRPGLERPAITLFRAQRLQIVEAIQPCIVLLR